MMGQTATLEQDIALQSPVGRDRAIPSVVPFHPDHLRRLTLREPQDRLDWLMAKAGIAEAAGPAFTGMVGETVLGCAGVVVLWPGVGEAWTVFDLDAFAYRLWLHRTIRQVLVDIMGGLNLHRIQANVASVSDRNKAWIESLGFSHEGTMTAFFPDGSDAERYALVRRHG